MVGVKECGLLACLGEHDVNKGDEVMLLHSRIPEVSGTVLFPANDQWKWPKYFSLDFRNSQKYLLLIKDSRNVAVSSII